MNWARWKEIVELVGIASIIIGLIFVGFQLEQDRRIAEAQLSSDGSAQTAVVAQLISDNIDVWVRGMDGEDLSRLEEIKFRVVARAVHADFSDAFDRGYRLGGFAPERIAQNYAYFIYSNPGYRRIWDERMKRLAMRNSVFDREVFIPENINARTFVGSVSEVLEDLDRRGASVSDPRSYTQ